MQVTVWELSAESGRTGGSGKRSGKARRNGSGAERRTNSVFLRRRESQMSLCKGGCICFVGADEVLLDRSRCHDVKNGVVRQLRRGWCMVLWGDNRAKKES